ncbi:hypothetical protein ACFY1J_31155 [Streptomyces sp. NPDC001406]|uniref:hypothetical protein n=1 Tax=Streptomyces sp. NPDC001406 TaxID=3364572 RepID=UPI0036AE4D2F
MADRDPDQETRDAVTALAHRLRQRDADAPGERLDAELFAREFVTALRTRGWRPTLARPAPPWKATPPPATPDTVHQRAAEIRSALRHPPTPTTE